MALTACPVGTETLPAAETPAQAGHVGPGFDARLAIADFWRLGTTSRRDRARASA